MEPGKADGVGRTPCLVSLIVKQVSLTSFASSDTVHSENLWGGGAKVTHSENSPEVHISGVLFHLD